MNFTHAGRGIPLNMNNDKCSGGNNYSFSFNSTQQHCYILCTDLCACHSGHMIKTNDCTDVYLHLCVIFTERQDLTETMPFKSHIYLHSVNVFTTLSKFKTHLGILYAAVNSKCNGTFQTECISM